MKPIIAVLKKILLAVELAIVIALVHWEKVLFAAIIALDQFTKSRIAETMRLGESIPVIPHLLHFTYVTNPGAAFGILPNQRVFFLAMGFALLALFAIFYPRLRKSDRLLKFGVLCLVSGSTANLIDRIQLGHVVDFFDFRVWAIFNVADVAVVAGMFVLIYVIVFKLDKPRRVEEAQR